VDKIKHPSLFLNNTPLRIRIAALITLGAGPFACREWTSLTILTLLAVFLGISRSVRSAFYVAFGVLISVLFCLVKSSSFLVTHSGLNTALIVFSAYGVALYALSVIVPHLDAKEFLQRSRTAYRPLRGFLVRVCHVVVLFLQGHASVLSEVEKNLRVAGVVATIFRPGTCVKYIGHFMTSLWLYVLFHAEAYTIAIDSRLIPWLDAFRCTRMRLTLQSYVVLFITVLAGYVVFQDFVVQMFKGGL
jgi:hypothetical protein